MACGEEEGKRINIEMTCGGGGRGENRMRKIQERNARVLRQREKRGRRGKGKAADRELRL